MSFLAALLFCVIPIEDKAGDLTAEVPTHFYRQVEYDLQEYPDLHSLAKKIMADGKITILEKIEWEKAVKRAAAKRLKEFIEKFDPTSPRVPLAPA